MGTATTAATANATAAVTTVTVVQSGIATTVQDLGRLGYAALGVGRSGAADPESHRLANRLVGNDEGAATIETTGNLVVRFDGPALIALAGAEAPAWLTDGGVGMWSPTSVGGGAVLRIGVARNGLRTYLAVRGGIDVAPVLGSRSRDTLAAIGPTITDGCVLPVGDEPAGVVTVDVAPQRARGNLVRVLPGPRVDWFTAEAWRSLVDGVYDVDAATSRVGARLSGPLLHRLRPGELPSEGMMPGAVQVPHDLQPIVMLADHPVTGGYPVIAVVHPADLAIVAQAAPGSRLRFTSAR